MRRIILAAVDADRQRAAFDDREADLRDVLARGVEAIAADLKAQARGRRPTPANVAGLAVRPAVLARIRADVERSLRGTFAAGAGGARAELDAARRRAVAPLRAGVVDKSQ